MLTSRQFLYKFGAGDSDLAIDVSVCCVECGNVSFAACIKTREDSKQAKYDNEVGLLPGMSFSPFVLGSHGGFGKAARSVWQLFLTHARRAVSRDWRHSWSSRDFGSVWIQKLSAALARRDATSVLLRSPLIQRRRAFGDAHPSHFSVEQAPEQPAPPDCVVVPRSRGRSLGHVRFALPDSL